MKEGKKRHGCVSAWLWIVIISNLGLGIYYATLMFSAYTNTISLGFGLLSILATLNVLGAILLMRWNKCGFYLFVVSSVLAALVNIGVLSLEPVVLLSGLFAILIWCGILQIKKDGVSAWSLLEDGWDYKHCRHLYQLFVFIIGILLVLTIVAYTGNHEGNPYEGILPSDDSELIVDSVAVEDDIVWQTFTDDNKACSIEAPNDFRKAELNSDQILGLMCTDYDPAVFVIAEPASSLKATGINSAKDYANVIVKLNSKNDDITGFNKISEETYGEDSYLIVYTLSVNDMQFRYSLLACRTEKKFYYCQVFCLEEYAETLQPTISHMLSSFKVLKKSV